MTAKPFDKRKRMRSNVRMKNKVTFAQMLASVRKQGGRPTAVFVPKTRKVKDDRNAWKREQE
jgi:hypothetical protein